MSGVNKVILLGRVGQDPKIQTFNSGDKIAKLSIATSETWKDKQSGERKEKTEWSNVVIKQDVLVSLVEKYVSKGDQIYIEGKMETRKWEKDGTEHYTTEVIVGFGGKIELIGGKKEGGGESSSSGETKGSGPVKPRASADMDDDIPFGPNFM